MASLRWTVWFALGCLPAAGVALGACAGASTASAPAVAPTSTAADDQAASDVTEHHRHHHHGGVTMFIAMSLDTLGTSPDEHAVIAKIQADLFAKMEPARAAEQKVMATLADGIEAGTIDTAQVDTALAQVARVAGALHDATAEALNELHAVLTPEQRGALVDKVEAHWTIWQNANSESGPAGSSRQGYLEALASELSLTADQVEKIRARSSASAKDAPGPLDSQTIETHLKVFGQAFKKDSFDARSLSTASAANTLLARWGSARMAHFFESVTPVLTPEQRAALAQSLHQHMSHQEGPDGQ
jgi:Spy/CpxP family protein refolding chaperone